MLHKPQTNIYTIEKKGVRKIIRQSPWVKDGVFSGIVEISFEIPEQMAHHVRE
jgi:predicted RNA methylase